MENSAQFVKNISENSNFISSCLSISDCCKIGSVLSVSLTGSLTLNSLPSPKVLLTVISPPWISTKDLTKDRPTPVPSTFRFKDLLTCINLLKILFTLSSSIPIPLSVT